MASARGDRAAISRRLCFFAFEMRRTTENYDRCTRDTRKLEIKREPIGFSVWLIMRLVNFDIYLFFSFLHPPSFLSFRLSSFGIFKLGTFPPNFSSARSIRFSKNERDRFQSSDGNGCHRLELTRSRESNEKRTSKRARAYNPPSLPSSL